MYATIHPGEIMMQRLRVRYRLGLDLGTNSLGWAILELDPDGRPIRLIDAGVRIFSDGRDPKSGASLAVDRRLARSMRRRRDRFLQRRSALLGALVRVGLLPDDRDDRRALVALDPYALRAAALEGPLPVHHLGRALFHLNQRRGFQSNRKTDRKSGDDTGKIAVGIDRLQAELTRSGCRTLGEYLHRRRQSGADQTPPYLSHVFTPTVRTRLRPESGEGAKGTGYDFYPSRALIRQEFEAIWAAQASHYPTLLTPEAHDWIAGILFHQRPLKAPKVGRCTLIWSEDRLPKAHPLFQRRRLLEEVNALAVQCPGQPLVRLSREQRDLLLLKVQDKKKVSFESLRKALKLPPEARFNKESEHRTELAGDEIRAVFADKKRFGPQWLQFSPDQQWEILSRLREEEDTATLLIWLQQTYGVSEDQAKAIAAAPLPEGYGRFGRTATAALIGALQEDVLVYSEAVARSGLGHHSDFRTGEVFEDQEGRSALPYYGVALERHILPGTGDPQDPDEKRIGSLANPTVHVGLNQVRRVVNTLMRRFGKPAEIVIELARDLKLSEEEKKKVNADNTRNRKEAEARSKKLVELGQPDTGANRARLKLWEDLNPENAMDRRCPYSGRQISAAMLFSDAVQVDHILPFSLTLDDSNANKILCLREANQLKRQRTPFEARDDFHARFGDDAAWEAIAQRAARLAGNKRWRFDPDAMQRFEGDRDFLARHLVDTQYLARLAREYLACLYPETGPGSGVVWASPGRLTEMVRRKLGLNSLLPDHNFGGGADQPKNRLDHRHHAIDAVVVGILDRGLLQQMARRAGQEGSEGLERISIPAPWETFRDDVKAVLNRIVVSHRPDHGKTGGAKTQQTAGQLHNDTAYGLTGAVDAKGLPIVVHRVPLLSVKPGHLDPKSEYGVRDRDLKRALHAATDGLEGKDFEAALRRFVDFGPVPFRQIRRVRVTEPLKVIPVRDAQGQPFKAYKGDSNYRYDVWELKDGSWQHEVVSMFDAHQPGWQSDVRRTNPTARKVLSLRQNDVIAIEDNGQRSLKRVIKFTQAGPVTLIDLVESGDLRKRNENPADPFRYYSPSASGLQRLKARQVRIDPLGRVSDPGFPARTARRKTRRHGG